MRLMYDSGYDKVKLQFLRSTVIGWDGLKFLVMIGPYKSIEGDIHKYLAVSGGAFMLVINAWHEEHYENEDTILECSPQKW